MIVNSLRISGYKSIREEQTVEFSDINVLLGENNVGKSTIIDALNDYRDLFPVANEVTSSWAHQRNTEKDPNGKITFELEYTLEEQEREIFYNHLNDEPLSETKIDRWKDNGYLKHITHSLSIESSLAPNEHVTGESIMTANFEDEQIDLRRGSLDEDEAEYLKFTKLPDKEYSDQRRIWINLKDIMKESIESWKFIDAFREPENFREARRDLELHKTGKNLTKVLLTLRGEKGDDFQKISNRYADIMTGIEGIRATLSKTNQTTVVVDEEEYDDVGFELSEISAGSKEILTLITKIVLAEGNTDLLLVEEPELHLHPAAEKNILNLLVDETNDGSELQVLLSTHSSVFVHHLDVDNIYRVNRQADTEITSTDSSTIGGDLRELGYEYAGMLQSEAVVVVEGATDKIALENLANKYDFDFEDKNIGVLVMGDGSRMVDYACPVSRVLKIFNVPYMFICDSDIGDEFDDDDTTKTPEAIEGCIYDLIKNDSSDHSGRDTVSIENIHAWKETEIEHYLLSDVEKVKEIYDTVDGSVIQDIIEDADLKPDRKLEKICKEKYGLPDGLDSLDKPTEISELSQSVDIKELPEEFHTVMRRIAKLVDAEETVESNLPTGTDGGE